MDAINITPSYPQKVEVVNQKGTTENPQIVDVDNLPLQSDGQSVRVYLINSSVSLRPTNNTSYLVFLDNILLLQSDGTFVPIPLNSFFQGLSSSNIESMLASYKTAYSTLVSGVTSATLHYSKCSNTGVITSEVYNLKD